MHTLRISQHAKDHDGYYQVELDLRDGQTAPVSSRFKFELSDDDQSDLRWYLEDFLQYPLDPAPTIAARIEQRMKDIGLQLFRDVFQAGDDARDLWATLRAQLNVLRIEISTEVQEATAIPWELLRDPTTDVPLALRAQSFVRVQRSPAQQPALPHAAEGEPIRILLVICRPGGRADVPFRSVASRIIKGLTDEAREHFHLDVLRPPTFEQLGKVLREAKADGHPYHIVHFDGHGLYAEPQPGSASFNRLLFSDNRPGKHGFLAFENPALPDNLEPISGPQLGALLVETNTPVLVLNACRSAHAELSTDQAAANIPHSEIDNPHLQVRALGSLAQEVMDAGVSGVVAMRYNVYVVTAAQFVAELYAKLAQGQSLGEAVTLGRKQLHDQPLRTIAYDPIPLQDWPVPIVYEAAPIQLFPKQRQTAPLNITLQLPTSNLQPQADGLPPRPDVGFYGRDETLLALDRAFDTQNIVLLWAYAGSGKTTTAVEFARWYAQTGGLEGPVLFTSFENYKPLSQVLDTLGRVFEQVLEANKIPWLALSNEQHRGIALAIMQQIPLLWIWDNVEPIAGFPTGTPSTWSAAEQKELADFLRDARDTKGKFLLTSRRDERSWLGDLPTRLTLPPMPMQERMQLARALADKYRVPFTTVKDWQPLLDFTQGNPLTITVVVGQALREGTASQDQIAAFLSKLRAGETTFADEQTEGRSKSLGASLSYGFTTAFTEDERRILALLHFFQGFVDVDAVRWMGDPTDEWCLPEVRGLTRETGIALLDRAAEVGLLTAHGGGYYSIHPALPWYFKSLFEQYYPSPQPSPIGEGADAPLHLGEGPGVRANRAFVEAMGELGTYYHRQYEQGNRDVIAMLEREEDNLLHARRLARLHGWWPRVISTMQGLRQLYGHTGRRAEWQTLVAEIVPDFVDPATDGPAPGREEQWDLVIDYRVRLAMEARQWAEAERLQRARVEWNRRRAASTLAMPSDKLDNRQRTSITNLAASEGLLANLLRDQGKAECIASFEEQYNLNLHANNSTGAAIAAFNLGHAYRILPALRDLDQAERWYRRLLDLSDEHDSLGRGKAHYCLGHVALERFMDARTAKQPEADLLRHLNAAVGFYQQALTLLPPNAIDDLAVAHNQLGIIYRSADDLDRALHHYRESIRYKEAAGNIYSAGETRCNVAIALANAGRLPDALLYAQAALRNFATYGDRAAEMIQRTQGLIAEIEGKMK